MEWWSKGVVAKTITPELHHSAQLSTFNSQLPTMPQFVCSYAHDIACYADFVVEARSERAALRQIRQALRDGKFASVDPAPCWENGASNARVFVQGVATEHAPATTLAELIGEVHRFSPQTRCCIHCGRHADDDALEPTPCQSATSP